MFQKKHIYKGGERYNDYDVCKDNVAEMEDELMQIEADRSQVLVCSRLAFVFRVRGRIDEHPDWVVSDESAPISEFFQKLIRDHEMQIRNEVDAEIARLRGLLGEKHEEFVDESFDSLRKGNGSGKDNN